MTTIAFRDGWMAADSQETNDTLKSTCTKIFKKKDEKGRPVLLGTAGGSYTGMIYVDWFGSGKERPEKIRDIFEDEDFHIIIWDGKKLWEVNWLWRPIEVTNTKFFAIGSGAAVALGAMEMGASAFEAVVTAKKYDTYTGGRVVSKQLEEW
jgi:hypothetical protein